MFVQCDRRGHFAEEERCKLDERQTAGERLGYLHHQRGRHGAEQQEAPHPASITVDCAAQPLEDLGPRLRLVQDHQLLTGCKSVPLKIQSETIRLLLQIEVLPAVTSCKRGLAALTRTDERNGGIGRQAPSDRRISYSQSHSMYYRIPILFCRLQRHHQPVPGVSRGKTPGGVTGRRIIWQARTCRPRPRDSDGSPGRRHPSASSTH